MLGQSIKRFADNLSALREFVEVTQPFLESRKTEVIKGRARDLAPILLAFEKIPNINFQLTDAQRQKIKTNFDGDIKLKQEIEDEQKGKITLSIEGAGSKPFEEAMEKLKIAGIIGVRSQLLLI